MPTRSQRHLREVQGVDSAGEAGGNARVTVASGDTVSPVKIRLEGSFIGGENVSVVITTDSQGAATAAVTAVAGPAALTADLLNTAINALTDVTSTLDGSIISALASGVATTIAASEPKVSF